MIDNFGKGILNSPFLLRREHVGGMEVLVEFIQGVHLDQGLVTSLENTLKCFIHVIHSLVEVEYWSAVHDEVAIKRIQQSLTKIDPIQMEPIKQKLERNTSAEDKIGKSFDSWLQQIENQVQCWEIANITNLGVNCVIYFDVKVFYLHFDGEILSDVQL